MATNTTDAVRSTSAIFVSQDFLQSNLGFSPSQNVSSLADVIKECNKQGITPARPAIEILIIVTGLPGNALLFWTLAKKKRALSPSEVLGLNLTVLSILFCSFLPLDVYSSMTIRAGLICRVCQMASVLGYFGCPLLLTGMCVERYVAVSHPVAFMKLRKWEYRAAGSALIWLLTFGMAAVTYVYGISLIAVSLSVIMNVLFFLMTVSLLGIVWVLCQKGPGEGRTGEHSDSIKKKVLKNILAILVPSTIVYGPLLALAPFLLLLVAIGHQGMNALLCTGLQMFSILPNFGVCIGPVFYMSRVRQALFCRKSVDVNLRQTEPENLGS